MTKNPENRVKTTAWTELSCSVPAEAAEAAADFLMGLSAGGVTIDNRFVDAFSPTEIEEATRLTLRCYLPPEIDPEPALESVREFLKLQETIFGITLPEPESVVVREEDWAGSWKANFHTTRVSDRVVVKPSWEPYEPLAGDIVLEIDPGMAFGTGTHATTRLCLQGVDRFFAACPQAGEARMLDVGTGSGILAIAAVKMGGAAVGIDIDQEAVTVAEENAALNGVLGTAAFSCTPLEEVPGTYGLVVANILAEELVKMAPRLTEKVAGGGLLVLSGILVEKEGLVEAGFRSLPLDLVATEREGEWSALTYRRRP